jgi:putative acetyltransferase
VIRIRPETEKDHATVRKIHLAAFPGPGESELVDRLRDRANPLISLLAELDDQLLGHILFTPLRLDSKPALRLMGLAPMAVLPARQKQGIGSALINAGLAQCRQLAIGAVAVLGHPHYYPRFGFVPSTAFNIQSAYDVAAEVFMLIELEPGFLHDCSGTVHYHEEFNRL